MIQEKNKYVSMYTIDYALSRGSDMVLMLDGNSEIVARVQIYIDHLFCKRHLFRPTEFENLNLLSKNTCFLYTCATDLCILYHLKLFVRAK